MENLLFLKLGGSLITDKSIPRTPRADVIARLAGEIKTVHHEMKGTKLVLGHGSGSFGHVAAKEHATRQGVTSPEGWHGFANVWFEAQALNRIVMEALHTTGLPAMAFPASASATARNGEVIRWDLAPLLAALSAGLLPVVYGDVVFDTLRGGTILSTEDIFTHLAHQLRPERILLAGMAQGVWADYPDCTRLIPSLTPANWETLLPVLGSAAETDVTGGMASKVKSMVDLVTHLPGLEVHVFGGNQPGNLAAACRGEHLGTRITAAPRLES